LIVDLKKEITSIWQKAWKPKMFLLWQTTVLMLKIRCVKLNKVISYISVLKILLDFYFAEPDYWVVPSRFQSFNFFSCFPSFF
jgi:hypothetical protein